MRQPVNLWSMLVIVWGSVAGLLAGVTVWRSAALHWRLGRASRPAPNSIAALLSEVGRSHGLAHVPEIMICSAVNVPALAGWWRPRVLLPEGFAERISVERLRLVLAHELAHWRRQDLWWQSIVSACLAVHWFNPLLWIARYRLREEAEAACDEWLLAGIGNDQARAYGETLLQVGAWLPEKASRWLPGAQGLLGMAVSSSGVRRRVLLVREWMLGRRASRWGGLAGLTVVTALGFLRAAEPKPENAPASAWHNKVQFHVFDEVTKAPLSGVRLTVRSGDEHRRETTTDAKGLAMVELPEAQPYSAQVLVRAEDRVPMLIRWSFDTPSFFPPEVMEMPMKKGTTIGGVILDEDDKPVPAANVTLNIQNNTTTGAAQEIVPQVLNYQMTTGNDGRWSYDQAPSAAKKIWLSVEHPAFVRTSNYVEEGNLALYYAGKVETRVRRGLKIEGTVVDAAGHPIKAKLIRGYKASDPSMSSTLQTDEQGRFVIPNAPSELNDVVTAFADGFAPTTVQFSNKQPVTIKLGEGRTLRVRVVDAQGAPVEGVTAVANEWYAEAALYRSLQVIERRFKTDGGGRFTWEYAPSDKISWDFLGPDNYRTARDIKITPRAQEIIVTLTPKVFVQGTVTDAETGKSVPEFRVTPGNLTAAQTWLGQKNSSVAWWTEGRRICKDGKLSIEAKWNPKSTTVWPENFVLRVSVAGYLPVVSEPLGALMQPKTWNVTLKKAEPVSVKVIQPDGKPAVGAKVVSNNVAGGRVMLEHGELTRQEWPDGADSVHIADASGVVSIPPESEPFEFVAVHSTGWGRLSPKGSATLQLQEWAGVEFDMKGLAPSLRKNVMFMPTIRDNEILGPMSWYFTLRGQSDEVRNSHLQPGTYSLGAIAGQEKCLPIVLELKAGEQRKIELAKLWRLFQLKASLKLPEGAMIDETRDDSFMIRRIGPSSTDVSRDLAGVKCKPVAKGGRWELQVNPFGLGAGNYRLKGLLWGWREKDDKNQSARMAWRVEQDFVIPESAMTAAQVETVSKGDLSSKTDTATPFELPEIGLR